MKRIVLWILGILLAISSLVYFSLSTGPSGEEYATSIQADRRRKNESMINGSESPFKDSKEPFDSLSYFPPDPRYRIVADLEPIRQKQVRLLITNRSAYQRYLDYAWATFQLDGQDCKLLILEVMDMGPNRGKLFLAFADETSTKETYGGGRYMDLKKVPAATTIELDFNKAYNPYCAYNHNYSCPLPPPENLLKVPILAGEKLYHQDSTDH